MSGAHECKDGSEISPSPWTIVRYPVPYYDWIMDGTGGIVCTGFGASDEQLLLTARDMYDVLGVVRTYLYNNSPYRYKEIGVSNKASDLLDAVDMVLAAATRRKS